MIDPKTKVKFYDDWRRSWELRKPHWYDPESPTGGFGAVVASVGDRPVSCVRLFRRELISPFARLQVVGIGGVFTVEDERKRGYCAAVMKVALHEIRIREYLAAILYTATDWDFYKQFGFFVLAPPKGESSESLWGTELHTRIRLTAGNWHVYPEDHF